MVRVNAKHDSLTTTVHSRRAEAEKNKAIVFNNILKYYAYYRS